MPKLKLSRKQALAWRLLEDPQVVELDYGGAAGGGKSILFCLWAVYQCRMYPGIRIGLGRKELKRLKETTVVTLLREAHQIMNVKPQDFNYQDQKGLIHYSNGSEIVLVDLVRQPSDPDFDTLGSLNLTHVIIEEAGEIVKKARDVFGSRKNRWLNKEYALVGKTVIGQNPSQNFTRQEFFEPYKALGMGDMQKWEFGEVEVKGKLIPAYRAFIKALPTDNPFISQNYLQVLNNLPPQERKRLRDGDWDYMDDEDMLFKPQLLDKASTSEVREGHKFIAVDPADKGKDNTVASLIEDGILTKQKHLTHNPNDPTPVSEQLALQLIKFAQTEGLRPSDAKDIAVEENGVGVGIRDFMKSKGWGITVYTATDITRSQAYYDASQDMDSGDLQILNSLETITELRRQLMAHTFEFDDKLRPRVLPKKKVREVLGKSPDEADSAIIANWIRRRLVNRVSTIVL